MAVLFLVTALANAIWQPIVIAGITWLALRLSRTSNATTKHAIWTIALVASVVVPLVSAVPVLRPVQHTVNNFTIPYTGPIKTTGAHLLPPSHRSTQSVLPTIARAQFTIPQTLAFWIAGLWIVAALAILVRLAFSFFYLERLKHDALPFPVDRRDVLARWEQADKGQRDVRICVTSETSVPIAVGIFDAMILLPAELVDELDANDLDRVLLHELAHVRRSDDWVNLFERITLALLFFSPGIYFIARQMDLEREVACDDWVLEKAAENVPYARCLARIVEMTQWPYRALAAPGVFVTRKSMSIRIERLLARGRDVRVRLAIVPSMIALVAIVAIVIAGGLVSPTIAYTLNQDLPIKQQATSAAKPPAKVMASIAPRIAATVAPMVAPTGTVHAATHVHVNVQKNVAATVVAEVNKATSPEAMQRWMASAGAHATADPEPTGSYLDELAAAGFKITDPNEIIEMKSVGVTGDYIREMRNAGLTDLSARMLVELKSIGVTPDFIRGIRESGVTGLASRDWEELKSVGATGEYVRAMRNAGLGDMSVRSLVELKSVGVTPEYVSAMRSSGLTGIDSRGLEELKSTGVTPDYINAMRSVGLSVQDARYWEEMKSSGVTPEYVGDLARAGYSHLSVSEYMELKSMGIDSAYIADLARHGFKNLSIQKLVEYKSEGIQ